MARHVTLYVAHTEHCQQVLFFFARNYPPYARASGSYRCPGLLKSTQTTPCAERLQDSLKLQHGYFNLE